MKLKTKKVIIITVSIVAIIIGLLSAYLFATGILKSDEIQIEGMEVPTISNKGQTIILSMLSLVNFIIILLSKNLVKHKKAMITLYAIQGLLGGIFNIIAAGICIPILCIKTEGVEEEKKKLELPVLEEVKQQPKWLYIVIWLAIFILAYTPIISYATEELNPFITLAIVIGVYILQFVGLILPMMGVLKRDFKAFKKNFKTYVSYITSKFGIFVLAYFIVAIITALIVGGISTNQEQINSLPIAVTAIMAILIAPFIEELMFRGFIKKIIGNGKLFIVVSSLVFGLVHIMFKEENLINYLYIIPYSVIGCFLASIYNKTDNIFTNMFAHCIWNTFATAMMVLMQVVG